MDDDGFADLIARIRAGDEDAARVLIERFGPEVQMMVRRRLPARLRSQYDTMDFAQAVWSSVIVDCRERPEAFEGPGHLLGFLAGVVQNKVAREYRRRTRTKKYDIGREERFYVRKGEREVPRDVAGSDPTPSENVQAGDRLDQLVEGRTAEEAEIILLRRQGLTYEEIAAKIGWNERSVRRVIEAVRQRMEARKWQ